MIDKACLQITMELLGQRNVWEGNQAKASVFSNKEASGVDGGTIVCARGAAHARFRLDESNMVK